MDSTEDLVVSRIGPDARKSPERDVLHFGSRRIFRLGGPLVSAHLLEDERGLALIDTGLWGVGGELRRLLAKLGRRPHELRDILLTHGHLDHAGGAAKIQAWTGARVWVHPADREHVAGTVRYTGAARVCGALERIGSVLARHRPALPNDDLKPGSVLPIWGGLRVWSLPGHTPGHCAFVSESAGLVFSGDTFASYSWSVHRPPAFLTRDTERALRSLRDLADANPAGILPAHYDTMDPALHARRLQALVARKAEVAHV
jgi:glyoxylase-like metal-dependent hydrolase (beta-lactamase superfamily II)